MAENQFTGLLDQMGLPSLSEEELANQRMSQHLQQRIAAIDTSGMPRKEQSFNRLGQMVGANLGARLAKSGLVSDKEKRQIEAVKAAEDRFKEFKKKNPEQAEAPQTAQLAYMKSLAAELMKSGDVSRGVQLLSAVDQREKALRKQDMELKKLGLSNEGAELGIDISKEKLDILRKGREGETGAFIPIGADLNNIGQSVVTGKVNEDGELVVTDPATGEEVRTTQFLSLDDALQIRDRMAKEAAKKGVSTFAELGIDDRVKAFQSNFAATDRRNARDRRGAISTQVKIMTSIADSFNKFIDEGRAPEEIMATPGRLSAFANNVQSIITAAGSSFKAVAGIGEDEDNPVVRLDGKGSVGDQIVKSGEYASLVEGISVPEAIASSGIGAEKYRAQVVELAYAIARANEPGARQLSDQDFRKALEQIGATSGDPKAFSEVVLNSLLRKYNSVKSDADSIAGIGKEFALSREKTLGLVYGTDFEEFDEKVEGVRDTYQRLGFSLRGQDPNQIAVGDAVYTLETD